MEKIIKWIKENKLLLIGIVIGIAVGLLIMLLTRKENIATLKDGTQNVVTFKDHNITANDLYDEMKSYYSVSILLDHIDRTILEAKYPETDEMKKEIDKTYSLYEQYYGDKLLASLQQSGINSIAEFKNVLKLDYLRSLATDDYAKSLISEDDIKNYYDKEVVGDINTKHILVKPDTNDNMSSEEKAQKEKEALNLAKEIIEKLNSGKSFDEVKKEYEKSITYEELGFQPFNASLEENYLKEMKSLKDGEYSKTPVKTSYGYHIVYRIEQKEKASLDSLKDTILDTLASNKKSADSKITYKALMKLREDNDLKFDDENLENKYNSYMDSLLNK